MLRPQKGNSKVSLNDTLLNFGLWVIQYIHTGLSSTFIQDYPVHSYKVIQYIYTGLYSRFIQDYLVIHTGLSSTFIQGYLVHSYRIIQ
jgi:hypothetical protein